jgi:competence CoiA-like predicted nuclease
MKMCEYYKLSYGFFKVEKGQQILGDTQQRFLVVEKEIGYQDYGVYIQDGAKYAEMKNKIMALAEVSLNAKEIRLEDLMQLETAESYTEAKNILKSAWKSIQQVAADQQQRQIEAQQQMQQQQLQMQQQMALENREDMQASRIDEINAKTEGQIRIDDNKMGKQMIVDTNNIEQKAVYDNKTGGTQPPMPPM